jgi:flagellar motor switch protein FliG
MNNQEPSNETIERVDTLIALGITFWGDEFQSSDSNKAADDELVNRISNSTSLSASVIEQRYKWYKTLPAETQQRWLIYTLSQARESNRKKFAYIDKNIHPSNIARALIKEPRRIQALILSGLPRSLVESVFPLIKDAELSIAGDSSSVDVYKSYSSDLPIAEIKKIVTSSFLSQFTSASNIRNPTDLDLLSTAEIAEVVKILGVRETAIACRAIPVVESVASFLRRFSTEDAQAIIKHISALTSIEPERVLFSEDVVRAAINVEPERPKALLNYVGLSVLSVALNSIDEIRARYTKQKLPYEVIDLLRKINMESVDHVLALSIVRDVETIATTLKKSRDWN